MSAWMRVRLRMSHGDASQLLKTSRLARSLPLTSQAWEQGRLSSGQIRVVVANVKTRHVDLFLGDEAQLIRSEEHTSELQSLMRISYAVFCLKNNIKKITLTQLHFYINTQ